MSAIPRTAYRPTEVATMLGVHRHTIRRWITTGKLATVTIGDGRFVPASALKGLNPSDEGDDAA